MKNEKSETNLINGMNFINVQLYKLKSYLCSLIY